MQVGECIELISSRQVVLFAVFVVFRRRRASSAVSITQGVASTGDVFLRVFFRVVPRNCRILEKVFKAAYIKVKMYISSMDCHFVIPAGD
jgi:hypothetical protein